MAESPYRAIWAFPWDLVDRGLVECLDELSDIGFTAVSVAAVYHSVQAFLPENPRRRWFTAMHSHANYRTHPLRNPGRRPPSLITADDSFAAVAAAVATASLDLTAWIVLHHSSLACSNPDLAMRPLGDPPVSGILCPSNPAVRAYSVALAQEIDQRFEPSAIDLEAVGWVGFPHHHHAKMALPLGASALYLLSLCFCDACRRLASPGLLEWVTKRLDREVRGTAKPVGVEELLADKPALLSFQREREGVVTELVAEIKSTVAARVHVAHGGEWRRAGIDVAGLAQVADRIVVLAYGSAGQPAAAAIADTARLAGPERTIAGLSLCAPETRDETSFRRLVSAAAAMDVREISVYNHSLITRDRLGWAAALAH